MSRFFEMLQLWIFQMDWDGDDLQVCVIVVQSIPEPKLFPLTFSYNGDVHV